MRTSALYLSLSLVATSVLGGCGSTLQFAADTFGVDVVSQSVREKAYKAASISFTAWERVQDGVERVGKLPRCTEAVKLLCVSQPAWDEVKRIEKVTSDILEASRPVITADGDAEELMAIPEVVYDAQAAIEAAKVN